MSVASLEMNVVQEITQRLGHSSDMICQRLKMYNHFEVYCLYLESLITANRVNELLIKPIVETNHAAVTEPKDPLDWLKQNIPYIRKSDLTELNECIDSLLEGHCLLILPGSGIALAYDVYNAQSRTISEPNSESVIRGSREGFIEDINSNVALIRKRLKSDQLVFESWTLGTVTKTKIYLVYMKQIASASVVDEFRRRLHAIRADSILESAYIEEWIQDRTYTPFPQLLSTERPDVTAAKLLEGSIAIMTDGTPVVILGPITLFQLFISPEDYYQRADIATLLRWLRMFAFLLAIFVPALYISGFHLHSFSKNGTGSASICLRKLISGMPCWRPSIR
ncbi:spore germination protein [Paenibacillus sp. R14(2021)]|uniref:spore germination protein n=1 Tax=Paenibacillus sp. R14(2021) TaxID=2859228 RepID=UPI001C615083|nr:spore germination protein [Paenibacillus sp. R14(2021)]